MTHTVYALLVGIDKYPPPIRPLHGCVNDIMRLEAMLRIRIIGEGVRFKSLPLLDSQAIRQAIIDGFRTHLAQAGPDDIALFYLSLSRLNHGLPRTQAHSEVVQGTAEFHHQIPNPFLPQP